MTSLRARIGPSILNSDLSSLANESQKLLDLGADYLHLDVMDGHFVPNLTFGHPIVACLRKRIPQAFLDLHMMVTEPKKWIQPMAECNVNQYTFHFEAIESTDDCNDCIRLIKEANMRVGLAIKPMTQIDLILPFIEDIDCVLIMTVEPGFGGQSFMPQMMSKVELLRQMYRELDIEVDGGVGPNTIHECANSGANLIVSGTSVVNAQNPRQVMQYMRDVVNEAIQRSQLER
jgi:ribulose-phosphate 3-epimerase